MEKLFIWVLKCRVLSDMIYDFHFHGCIFAQYLNKWRNATRKTQLQYRHFTPGEAHEWHDVVDDVDVVCSRPREPSDWYQTSFKGTLRCCDFQKKSKNSKKNP